MDVAGAGIALGSFAACFGVGWWFLNRSLYNNLDERDYKVQVRVQSAQCAFPRSCLAAQLLTPSPPVPHRHYGRLCSRCHATSSRLYCSKLWTSWMPGVCVARVRGVGGSPAADASSTGARTAAC